MKTYINGLLHASGDLSEYTVTKTDEFGIARSETCVVIQKEISKDSSLSKEPVSSESIVFSSTIIE